jgi:2'-5' RNA ligase
LRVFFAIVLPPVIQRELAALETDLGDARWSNAEQLHLTLRFLGEVDEAGVRRLLDPPRIDVERQAIRVRGVGVFGSPSRPRVLWTTIDPADGVRSIATELDRRARAIGIPKEARAFTPHITLARFKRGDGARVKRFLADHARFATAPFEVNEVVLFSSTLTARGAIHDPLARLPLA